MPDARSRTAPAAPLASAAPVARVAVDVSLAHLDRPFDYAVPASMDVDAVAGVRVRVRFAGRLVNGYLLERVAETDHGKGVEGLLRLQRVVSAEPVLTPAVAHLARAVADRYAGTRADVLRLAVPPRHARVEGEPPPDRDPVPAPPAVDLDAWSGHPAAPGFLEALTRGDAPRAVWSAPPGTDVPAAVAAAVASTVAGGRGALVVVPDSRDVDTFAPALRAAVGEERCVVLTAETGPAVRYRRWLAVRRGHAPVVIGTRAAMFAPVQDLGLAVVWDDGDDLHAEPRAPYPHVREVLALRSLHEGCGLLVAGRARTAEGARLLATGWARDLDPDRAHVRAGVPLVRTVGGDTELARDPAARAARLPSIAWEVARAALATGPVLVQVPRRGYAPSLACTRCREPARCTHCAGPLAATAAGRASCTWCGRPSTGWACGTCGGTELRAVTIGARRTAEELARSFPGVPVRTSGREGVLATVTDKPALVVATPGAEPRVEAADGSHPGYAAALLLDGDRLVARPDLRAGEEAVRRWLNAAAEVRPANAGGTVVIVADPALAAVQALVRWDPAGFATRELADRAALHLPPSARVAVLTGPPVAVGDLLDRTELPGGAEVLGPTVVEGSNASGPSVPDDERDVRVLVRVPLARGADLASALHAASAVRSARKESTHVSVRIDPVVLG